MPPQSFGRVQTLLNSIGPLVLVVPQADATSYEMSIALRIAHDLNAYLRLDTTIVTDIDAEVLNQGNIVVIGNGVSGKTSSKGLPILRFLGLKFQSKGRTYLLLTVQERVRQRIVLFPAHRQTFRRRRHLYSRTSNPCRRKGSLSSSHR